MSDFVFVLNNASWPALLLEADGKIREGNPAALEVFGQGLKSGTTRLADIWSPENPATADAFLAEGAKRPRGAESLRFRGRAGVASFTATLCQFAVEPRGGFLLQLFPPPEVGNAALIQKQKLECALQLARTMALDFNNALTSILGHTSLLLGRAEPTHPWRASLVEVEKSAARAAEIASDLAAFSRQDKEPRSQASGNLNQLLQRVAELFQNSSPGKAVWNLQLERRLYTAKFDEAKMQQVFVKIIENALQALGKNGRITLQSRNVDLTSATQDRNAQLAAGSYVCMEITDNGGGIPEEILPRIFEPFFTTKKGPQHRGLGLAWVWGVVANHGGGVAVSSTPGQGTSVRVYLPAEKKLIRDTALDNASLKGGQTVLIVDDEDLLLTMGDAILSSFGYKVLTANSGLKALEILAKDDSAVDLLVTDLVMPGMSGRELVDQARQLHPDLRVLCTSGYVFHGKNEEDATYLQKPFTSRELLLKVKQALTDEE